MKKFLEIIDSDKLLFAERWYGHEFWQVLLVQLVEVVIRKHILRSVGEGINSRRDSSCVFALGKQWPVRAWVVRHLPQVTDQEVILLILLLESTIFYSRTTSRTQEISLTQGFFLETQGFSIQTQEC